MDGWGCRWVDGGVGGCDVWGMPHAHTHTCMLNMINMEASMGWPFAISIHVYFSVMDMCMHACICVHVGAYGGTPRLTPPHTHKSWGAQITKYAIKLEQIEIIRFEIGSNSDKACVCTMKG